MLLMPRRMPNSALLTLRGEDLVLLPQRALWWPRRSTLVVADIHLGKSETYRALGVPIPAGIGEEALARLESVCAACGAKRLVILGDLVHSRAAISPGVLAAVESVRPRLPNEIILVRGNHDRAVEGLPAGWRIEAVDEPLDDEPLALLHHPAAVPRRFALAGHLHPTFFAGTGLGGLRLPCFHFGPRLGVLPAFSAFSRGVPMGLEHGDSVFVIADGEVMQVGGGASAPLADQSAAANDQTAA